MEWMERMNRTMDYIEENLSGRIDPEQIARIMACPYAVFQRGFGPIAGVQLAEYIRRRRLSCAAYDLQHTSLRVIDVAVKYGYDSADAFAAAFRRMHGLTPQEARKPGAKLSFYPRLTFSLRIVGTEKMHYEVCELPAFSVLGIRRTTPWGGGTWGVIKQNGQIHDIERVCGHACDLGLCFGFAEDGSNDYFCGARYAGPDVLGFDRTELPEGLWLKFFAEGRISAGVLGETWKRIYGEFMPQSEYCQIDLPTIERYVRWDEAADDCLVEILIPVKRS